VLVRPLISKRAVLEVKSTFHFRSALWRFPAIVVVSTLSYVLVQAIGGYGSRMVVAVQYALLCFWFFESGISVPARVEAALSVYEPHAFSRGTGYWMGHNSSWQPSTTRLPSCVAAMAEVPRFFAPWDSRRKLEPIFGSEKTFFQDGDGGRRLIHTSHDPMPDDGLRQWFDPDASKK
jgi:hypothetical protein